MQQHYSKNNFNSSDNWILLNPIETNIKNKIEQYGTPLSEWNIQINYGIKTGYNDAFIINESTKNALIASDPKSEELIRPILRGKDIKRYSYEFARLWVIYVPCGYTNNHKGNSDPETWFKKTHPSIYSYLINTEMELSKNRSKKSKGLYKRDDQGDYWWELRSCKYLDEFYKQKIMYNDINRRLSFCLVDKGIFCNNTIYFISTEIHQNYFLAILNSKLINWYYKTLPVQLGENAVRMFTIYVNKIPIPKINSQKEKEISILVDEFLKSFNPEIDSKLDTLIFDLYNLTKEEIEYIKINF